MSSSITARFMAFIGKIAREGAEVCGGRPYAAEVCGDGRRGLRTRRGRRRGQRCPPPPTPPSGPRPLRRPYAAPPRSSDFPHVSAAAAARRRGLRTRRGPCRTAVRRRGKEAVAVSALADESRRRVAAEDTESAAAAPPDGPTARPHRRPAGYVRADGGGGGDTSSPRLAKKRATRRTTSPITITFPACDKASSTVIPPSSSCRRDAMDASSCVTCRAIGISSTINLSLNGRYLVFKEYPCAQLEMS